MALFEPSDIGLPDRSPNSKLIVGDRGIAQSQGANGEFEVILEANNIGDIPIDINSSSIDGGIPIDIETQSANNITTDIAAQSVGNLETDIAAQSVENLDANIAAQSVGDLAVDIAAQTISELGIDIEAQTLGDVTIGGDADLPLNQEPGSGKVVYRRGAVASEADIDIGNVSNPLDLTQSNFSSGVRDAGGAEALAIEVIDDDGYTFNVEVDWYDDNGNITITHSPPSLTQVSDVEANLIMRSDKFELRIENNNGATSVHGTANAH